MMKKIFTPSEKAADSKVRGGSMLPLERLFLTGFVSILVSLAFLSFSYSQSRYKDPFEPLLPQEVKETDKRQEGVINEAEESLPSMVVQGILWGNDSPQAIIDGEVYGVSDKIKNIDAKIFKIDKGAVFISYGEKIYKIEIGKKEER